MAVVQSKGPNLSKYLVDGTVDLDAAGSTISVALLTSTCTVANLQAANVFGSTGVSANEVANGNGYTTGGIAVSSVTLNLATGTTTFDFADPIWTASGAGITAKWAVVYCNATLNGVVKPVLTYIDMDNTSAGTSVTTTAGNTLTLQINAAGLFTIA